VRFLAEFVEKAGAADAAPLGEEMKAGAVAEVAEVFFHFEEMFEIGKKEEGVALGEG